MLFQLITDKIGPAGRMISGSKSGYRNSYPDNLAIFNANLCTKGGGKIWYGDVDVTKSKDALVEIAKKSGEAIYVLYEMDARFESEDAPILDRAAVVFHPDGSHTLAERLKEFYQL